MPLQASCLIDFFEKRYRMIKQVLRPGIVYRFVHVDEPYFWFERLGYVAGGAKKFCTTAIPFIYVCEIGPSITKHSLALNATLEEYGVQGYPVDYLTLYAETGWLSDPISGDSVYPFEFEVRFTERFQARDINGEVDFYLYHISYTELGDMEYDFDGINWIALDDSDPGVGYTLRNGLAPFFKVETIQPEHPPEAVASYLLGVDLWRYDSLNSLVSIMDSYIAQKATHYVVEGEEPDLTQLLEGLTIEDNSVNVVVERLEELTDTRVAKNTARSIISECMQDGGLINRRSYINRVASTLSSLASEMLDHINACSRREGSSIMGWRVLRRRRQPRSLSTLYAQRAYELLRYYLDDDTAFRIARGLDRAPVTKCTVERFLYHSIVRSGAFDPATAKAIAASVAREVEHYLP